MDAIVALEVAAVVTAWAVLAVTIRRWGPGRRQRSVRCPEKKLRAKVEVKHREADYGSIQASDVLTCSLIPAGPVDCEKKCLDKL